MPEYHKPVLVREVLECLDPQPGGTYLDATLGGGGHAEKLLEESGPNGVLIGIDRDPEAIRFAAERLSRFGSRVRLHQGNFREIPQVLAGTGIGRIDGAIFDLGVSSHQIDARGFSFLRDEPLDMRMNPEEDVPTAADLVNELSETELADTIRDYGEERYARRIAKAIVRQRAEGAITTTGELVAVIQSAVGAKYRDQDIHAGTRTFQALRIRVNDELGAIEPGVQAAVDALGVGGKVCVISFHSLEDRIVKRLFRRLSGRCECPPRLPVCRCGAHRVLAVLTGRPIAPGADEVSENPRSRSARLRCARKVI